MTLTVDQLDVVETPAGMTMLPLNRLMLSNLNVRQTERDADIASLADDIAARGLKQNLVVVPAHFSTGISEDWDDQFEVIAGGRRYQAMQLLVDDGRLPADHPVPVLIEERDQAKATSLSENLHKVTMNPVDEFEAYRAIVADWMQANALGAVSEGAADCPAAIEYCARRFGKTVKHVTGRLRLATLAPEILQAMRENALGVESAKAYAGSTDHERQVKVFKEQCKSNWKPHDPAIVRSALRNDSLSIDCALIRFVGLDAYRAAGGRTEVEMFMGTDGEERVTDLKLLDKLAADKASPLVAPQAKADGFGSGLLAKGLGVHAKWPPVPKDMERHRAYYQDKEPTKAQLKKAVAVYAIDTTGDGSIQRIGFYWTPPPRKASDDDWEQVRAEQARARGIRRIAARAATDFSSKGTSIEGKAFWPQHNVNPVEDDRTDDNFVMVALQIRVPRADVEARLAEAEKQYDADLAAAEAAKADPDGDADEDADEAEQGE